MPSENHLAAIFYPYLLVGQLQDNPCTVPKAISTFYLFNGACNKAIAWAAASDCVIMVLNSSS